MLPAAHLSNPYGYTTGLVIYLMLVKTFVNTVLYDARDVKGDKESGVRTIPVLLGSKMTLIILLAINSTLWPWLLFIDISLRLFSAILIVYGYAYILYFRERRNPSALDLFVDGEWILATALLWALYKTGMMVH